MSYIVDVRQEFKYTSELSNFFQVGIIYFE